MEHVLYRVTRDSPVTHQILQYTQYHSKVYTLQLVHRLLTEYRDQETQLQPCCSTPPFGFCWSVYLYQP